MVVAAKVGGAELVVVDEVSVGVLRNRRGVGGSRRRCYLSSIISIGEIDIVEVFIMVSGNKTCAWPILAVLY